MTTYTITVTQLGDDGQVVGGSPQSIVVTDGAGDGTTGAVSSVNGHTGVVNLTATDVGADASGAAAAALVTAEAYTDTAVAGLGGGAVDSVNGQTGVVVLAAADVGAATTAQGATADSAVQPGDLGTAASAATTDFDVAGAAASAQAASQPLDSDLTAIAALTTTAFGRALLALVDAPALRTAAGLGDASTHAAADFDAAGAAAAAQAASQPLDSDLTAIAALATTTFGRSLLTAADAAAGRTLLGAGTSSLVLGTTSSTAKAGDYQPAAANISDATTIGRTILTAATAAAVRTAIGLAAVAATGAYADLTGLPTLGTAAAANTGTTSGTVPLLSTGGLLPIARIASGTPDGTKFVRDDGTLATPAGGGTVTSVTAGDSTITIGGTSAAPTVAVNTVDATKVTHTINAQTGTSYTTVLTDGGKFVTMTNAAASTLTVPPNSSVAYPVGTLIEGAQFGAGQVTLTPGSGVTINATPGLKVAAQYGTFGLLKTATDTWLAYGRLSA